jgi:hypothetical protein
MRVSSFLTCLFVAFVAVGTTHAADAKSATYTDPAQAGPDFAFQGEYAGTLKTDEGDRKFGAQVIALGDGKFRGIGYPGGLPGAGWSRGGETHSHDGQVVDGVLRFSSDEVQIECRDGKITISNNGQVIGQLEKVERKSPTLGAAPPAGAKVLFDGKSAETFTNGKIIEENLLGATNAESKLLLGDHHLHIEFRTPFMPLARGQGRGNSGVYVQGRYEVQVLDSFGLEGKDNECGGIYSISQPNVNMCLPPLAWQTYDIDFTAARYDDAGKKTQNARITVRHNGVVIHDHIELAKGTPGKHPEGPAKAGLFLQDHGNPVAFRNIWVVEK